MSLQSERPKAVSLFSGAGGLDLGLEQAGFEVVSMVEADDDCVASLEANRGRTIACEFGPSPAFQSSKIIHRKIEAVVLKDLVPARTGEIALLSGGPPCQPFSAAGKLRSLEDPRGNLFRHFVRLAKELRPPFILFENVQGLVTAKGPNGVPGEVLGMVCAEFERLGYGTRVALLNSADYGVPQRRVRFFLIASLHSPLPHFPEPTHSKDVSETSLFGPKEWVSLRDALGSFPVPDEGDLVRPKPDLEAELLTLTPGTGLRTGGILEANRPGGHWGYRQDGFLADPGLPSRTIRTLPSPDWVYDDSGRLRRLTWRECATLQGFPIDWQFVGSRSSKFKQIGNAVPAWLGRSLGVSLADAIASLDRTSKPPGSVDYPERFVRAIKYTISENRVNGESREKRVRL